jgi:phospholipid transport system transporter-binding protein
MTRPAPAEALGTVIEGDAAAFRVRGPITMANVQAVLEAGHERFRADEVSVDLGQVTEVDSASVSLLLQWVREAQSQGRRLRYLNLNSNVKSLAVLYGVIDLLPLQERVEPDTAASR